ncbi:transposon-transfer assisting family protein [Ruminococcaceae bacterium OttesenSCG-928-L11]|nr:transposon-transfer assisting family protein [Ruminococcaceae bacterium OttesenSCG-928-L11]
MPEIFTVEEINLIAIFDRRDAGPARSALIAELIDAMGDFDEEELLEIAISALEKLSIMSDADFAAIKFFPEYGELED